MNLRSRLLTVPLAAAATVVLIAAPSFALVTKSGGSISCHSIPDAPHVAVQAHGQGNINEYLSGGFVHYVYLASTAQNYWTSSAGGATSWKVTSDGTLFDSGTGVYCA